MKIDKRQASEYLKKYPYKNGDVKINNDESLTLTINLGATMEKKISKSDLILQKLDKIESDVSELKSDVAILKSDVKILKREATKHGWDLNN